MPCVKQHESNDAAQARANGGAGGAAEAVADDRAPCCAKTAANRGFGAVAFVRADGTAGRAANTCADRCARAAAKLSANHITQRTAETTAYGSGAVSGRHRALRHDQAKK